MHFAPGDIVTYREMCTAEEINTLQRGMNYRLHSRQSVLLMSTRPGAPYRDRVQEDGSVLLYEGHDEPRFQDGPDPKTLDQPLHTGTGRPTQNGLFWQAAEARGNGRDAELVRVYEKIKAGVWVFNGTFRLTKAYREHDGARQVCVFRLEITADSAASNVPTDLTHNRLIPAVIKQAVWKRDQGRCVECGSNTNLHFDHVIPFSKGGSSLVEENIQLLCAKHNLQKSDKIL